MDITGIIAVTGGLLVVLIPIAGITARFALKPIVESVARMREIQGAANPGALRQLDQRLSMLEQQMQTVESSVHALTEAREFERKLASGQP